ncbi:DnaJ-domain-containing protein [Laetiporus sulphureus 93-53]|uniref:DnaJ-domain-containing protein n=1 Tax=Laetiporus sulphureus 93-53 TaxID=1314785 RepID=A0A165E2H5_9APHY|nr:DnaJ-domain-containing protein [Laetiporus sulphureus 93-53]KZT06119.1 DnaJ-domain-containing protein [Laetiporus sulphureus 93-53]
MLSYVLGSATSYFHFPIEDEPDDGDALRHIAWDPSLRSADHTDSDDTDAPPTPSSSTAPRTQNRTVIQDILEQDDLYRILGLQRTSRIDKLALRRAYLSRSRVCHPDKFHNNPFATRAFQKVSVAYDVLSQPASKRAYDRASSSASYDMFAARPRPPPEDTFRGVVISVFNELLEGDLDVVRTLLSAVNDMNPSLRLGEDGINSVLLTLQSIRERALTCRTCLLALHDELMHLLEVQRTLRALSYFDLRRRSCLALRLARLTVALPIVVDHAVMRERGADTDTDDGQRTALLNARIYGLLRGLVVVLERMERILR